MGIIHQKRTRREVLKNRFIDSAYQRETSNKKNERYQRGEKNMKIIEKFNYCQHFVEMEVSVEKNKEVISEK